MAMLSKVDLQVMRASHIQDARNPLLAERVCRGLSLGLLSEGMRRSGRWASQLTIGRLSILFVVLGRDNRPPKIEPE